MQMSSAPSSFAPVPAGVLWRALIVAAPLLLEGCAALAIGGATAGAAAIHDRRDYTDMLDDQEIELRAKVALTSDPTVRGHNNIDVTSYNHKVLLTGQAYTEAVATQAAAVVSRIPKVERVIDEVTVGPGLSYKQDGTDAYLTTRVKIALADVKIPGFDPLRVKVVTEDSVVYLMGILTPQEADAVAEKVRWVPGVKRVVRLFEIREPQHSTEAPVESPR